MHFSCLSSFTVTHWSLWNCSLEKKEPHKQVELGIPVLPSLISEDLEHSTWSERSLRSDVISRWCSMNLIWTQHFVRVYVQAQKKNVLYTQMYRAKSPLLQAVISSIKNHFPSLHYSCLDSWWIINVLRFTHNVMKHLIANSSGSVLKFTAIIKKWSFLS